jgi:hypothetical protein
MRTRAPVGVCTAAHNHLGLPSGSIRSRCAFILILLCGRVSVHRCFIRTSSAHASDFFQPEPSYDLSASSTRFYRDCQRRHITPRLSHFFRNSPSQCSGSGALPLRKFLGEEPCSHQLYHCPWFFASLTRSCYFLRRYAPCRTRIEFTFNSRCAFVLILLCGRRTTFHQVLLGSTVTVSVVTSLPDFFRNSPSLMFRPRCATTRKIPRQRAL